MLKVIAFTCIVIGVLAVLWLALASDCGAGNCKAFKWQQTTITSCRCWYRGCDGKCTREGTWDGGSLKCSCPDISTCGNDITGQAVPKPTPTIRSLLQVGPAPTANAIRVNPTPQPKLPSVRTCRWYPGLDPGKELVVDEVRKDPTTGITWKCLADGTTIKLRDDLVTAETLIIQTQPWPGGFRGCVRNYGAGWHLSSGSCVKVMKQCLYAGGFVYVGARDSCDRY